MDTGSYTFQTLCSKYEDFRGPAFTSRWTGKKLKSSEIPLYGGGGAVRRRLGGRMPLSDREPV